MRSLHAEINVCFRQILAFQKKRIRPSRFKRLLTDEEANRRCEEDFQRAYGDHTKTAKELEAQAKPPTPLVPQTPTASPNPKPKPWPPPDDKRDITQVPLCILPNGFLGCDWDAVRPSKKK